VPYHGQNIDGFGKDPFSLPLRKGIKERRRGIFSPCSGTINMRTEQDHSRLEGPPATVFRIDFEYLRIMVC
jgi:hypothetical protein